MGTEIVSRQVAAIDDALIQTRDQFVETLPVQLRAEAGRFRSVLIDLLMEPDSALAKCEPASIVKAALEAAALGLFFTRHLGHAYLIPYDGKAEMQIGVRGLIHLAKNADPTISDIKPEIVYPGEEFQELLGLEPNLIHVPRAGERGNISINNSGQLSGFTHAYAVARYRSDSRRPPTYVLMALSDVQKCKNASKTKKTTTPWWTWTKPMVEKCPTRKLCMRLGLVPWVTAAIVRDEYREFGVEHTTTPAALPVRMPQRLSASAPAQPSAPPPVQDPNYADDIPPICGVCDEAMQFKTGLYVPFWGCAKYKNKDHIAGKKNGVMINIGAEKWHTIEQERLDKIEAAAKADDVQQPEDQNQEREPGQD